MIDLFRGDYFFLSNFYPCTITISKEVYPSVEHAYQALKSTDPKDRLPFQNPDLTPGKAKRMGKEIVLRKDWELIKVDVTFTFSGSTAECLLQQGEAMTGNDNPGHAIFSKRFETFKKLTAEVGEKKAWEKMFEGYPERHKKSMDSS